MLPGKYTKSGVFGGDDGKPRAYTAGNAPDDVLRQFPLTRPLQRLTPLVPPPEAPKEPPAAAPTDG